MRFLILNNDLNLFVAPVFEYTAHVFAYFSFDLGYNQMTYFLTDF